MIRCTCTHVGDDDEEGLVLEENDSGTVDIEGETIVEEGASGDSGTLVVRNSTSLCEMQVEQQWWGYKIVGDNIDKSVKPSFGRVDAPSQSLHYFHAYSVLDRIDLSGVSDITPSTPLNITELLPSTEDIHLIKSQFTILISRYNNITFMCNYMSSEL